MAKRTKHYDSSGRYIGESWDYGNRVKHFGADGKYTGETCGNKHYDSSGKYTGESWRDGKRKKHYDSGGKYKGESWQDEKREKHYDSRGQYGGESWKDDGGGCFITSACVEARNLSGDCLELTVIRNFRDTYIRSLSIGERIMADYYAIAPQIVARINQRDNAVEVYQNLFDRLIVRTLDLIKSGKKQEAFLNYQAIVEELRERYL